MGFDQIPIYGAAVQMRGPCQPEHHVRSVQHQVLPISDARQQLDAEKVR
jgi:hypothetical protein